MVCNNIKSRFTKSRLDKWGDIMFICRKQELQFLNDRYNSKGGQLVVLYGRRRVGKTETLREFCKGKPHVFYSSREVSDKYLVGECKFKGKPFSFGEYLDTSAKLSQQKEKAEFYYMLFSESGFDDKLSAEAEKDGKIMLVDIERIVKN